ncbi:MAG TPA: response regulator transcription factor [Thermoanaerobaculia bacterium]|nr:response regulator transcription factor [Thermoanaerobaculia bacterium]
MNAPSKRILLVEDEPSLVITLTDRLKSEGYQVRSAGDADTALREIVDGTYDLAIFDVMLPGRSGFDLCQDVRQRGIGLPILMLTARSQVVDRVVGLKIGADDYLTKPFEMAELLARIEALLRRARMPIARAAANYIFGNIEVDFRAAEVFRSGERVPLSALEFKLLTYLVEHRGTVVTREELLDHVWGYNATPFTRTVDVHIAALRQKLEEKPSRPQFILTAHRLGYRFAG